MSEHTRKVIDLITIQEDINPVGSQKFKIQKYPSDIDVFESYRACCDLQSAGEQIVSELKKIAKDLKKDKTVYFGDFKAGLDDRYIIDLGQLDYLEQIARNFDKKVITKKLSNLLKTNLLTEQEYVEILTLVKQPITPSNFEKIKDFFKSKQTIRWTLDELIAGEKQLPLGKTLLLKDAITHQSPVKIDVWSKILGRFTEITNFFVFVYIDKKGKEHVLGPQLGNLIDSFIKDILL